MFQRIAMGLTALTIVSGFSPALADTPLGQMPQQITTIFAKPAYQSAIWGLRVIDTDSDRVLIDVQPNHPFFIGSVRKIFSVGLLLNELGPLHTYDTPVFRRGQVDEKGLLSGDLVLVASGDLTMGGRTNPDGSIAYTGYDHNEANSLGQAVLSKPDPLAGYKELARQVAASGITRISGDVIIDDRLFQPFNFRDEFDVTPAFVNDDVVDLSIMPGTPGRSAKVEVRPKSKALNVVNNVMTSSKGSEMNLELDPESPQNIGTPGASAKVEGLLPVNFRPPLNQEFPLIRTLRIANPSNYARTVFIEALKAQRIQVDAPAVAPNPVVKLEGQSRFDPADQVALLQGAPYGEVAKFILKVSYNIGADTSLVLWGLTQGVDQMAQALTKEQEILTSRYGLSSEDYHFLDGSGGGDTTATNQVVTSMLDKLQDSSQHEAFLDALPVLAVDGSLGFVTEFQADPSLAGAAGQVRAKTGTYVTGTEAGMVARGQAFGGYIKTKSGRNLAYSLVVNEVPIAAMDDLLKIFQDQGTISAILWRDL